MRRLPRDLPALLTLAVLVPFVVCLASPVRAQTADTYSADERAHWSLQPRSRPAPPVTDGAWASKPIDAFSLDRLERANLRPAPRADRRTLIRRAYFNLTGLPPLPEEIAAFEGDPAPDAYERLIDRLLASPHYGEEWGQHWLDVARYSESEGFEYDRHRAGAWRFRDYVIQSLNADKPYDQFVIEQLAGDELPAKEGDFEARIAAGFQRLGPIRRNAGNTDVAFSRNEVLTEMTDAVGADPDYPAAHAFLAVILRDLGRPDYALRELDKLDELDPPAEILQQVSGLRQEPEASTADEPPVTIKSRSRDVTSRRHEPSPVPLVASHSR